MNAGKTAKNWFGINWQMTGSSGWGLLALNLALEAEREGEYGAIPLAGTTSLDWVPTQYAPMLQTILDRSKARDAQVPAPRDEHFDFPVLYALGNRLTSHDPAEHLVGNRNLGFVFFEDSQIGPDALSIANRFDLLVTGSSWNTLVLRRSHVSNVRTLFQGLDLSIFRPLRRDRSSRNPFVIFSGGKLEFRKGQDIVVKAFRRFRSRHPESILLTVWHNHWPESIRGIDSTGYVQGLPELNSEGNLEIGAWLERNGIPREALYNLPAVPNYAMPEIYQQADVALFPNRCEGGTNLVAMECLASGLPTILSANTGHLDLIDEKHCYPLLKQGPVKPLAPVANGTEDWGESNVEEIIEKLEQVFTDAHEAERRANAAIRFMQDWSWQKTYTGLKKHLSDPTA